MPRVQTEQLANLFHVPDSNAETAAVQPDHDANNLGHLADLKEVLIPGVQPGKRIAKFVQNLRKANIENDVLAVPGGALLGGSSDLYFLGGKLLVRQCYKDLKNEMIKISEAQICGGGYSDAFLIMGNPGIGKSLFAYYLIYELMRLKKTIVWKPSDSKKIVCITETTIRFSKDIDEFEDELEEASTWYIVDGQPPVTFPAITVLVTSPDPCKWKNLAKRYPLIRYMPVWSWAEIQMIKPRGMAFVKSESGYVELDDSVIKEQYRIWGGIPRYVFQDALRAGVNKSFEKAIKKMAVENLYRYIGEADARDLRHQVMHMIVTIDCAEKDRYQDYVMDFASEYVRELVLSRALELKHETVKEFITSASDEAKAAIFGGILFEVYVHTFLRSDREFIVRKLDANSPNEQQHFSVKLGSLRLKEFEELSVIDEPECMKDYFKPISRNYPSIDSLMYPNCLFQFSVSGTRVIDTNVMTQVVNEMLVRRKRAPNAEEKNFRLYFVVPENKFDFFKRQKYTNEEPAFPDDIRVDQYALQADLDSIYFSKPMVATIPISAKSGSNE